MATTTTRLLRTYRPIQLLHSSWSSSSLVKCLRHQSSRASLNNNNGDNKGERITKPVVAVKAASLAAATNTAMSAPPAAIREGLSNLLAALIASAAKMKRNKLWKWNNDLQPEMMIERAIIDCRFFTLFAVAGSLLGSVLCFVEGCVLIVESYGHYFHTLAQRLDQNHLVHLLIEAIDMFLVGTALLIFGAGLYEMFVGSRSAANNNNDKKKGKEKDATTSMQSESNLLDLFYTKRSSSRRWVGMQSIEEAKSKIGHAVMMILQVGVLEKLKDIPLLTGIDLACLAAAVLTSSASIFVLSRLYS
ncbi:hypothetical protein PIB30_079253 [Stylosanthes scabra]|uniref:Uncharacterized protein n=1 Tax=Stylosanthes scabra TaxID=79078 RepID=A0ABU6UPV6_9FABA|nr:hypothetical protein [Stylosanthes scabra]